MLINERLIAIKKWSRSFFLPCAENGYRAKIFTGNFLMIFFFLAVLLKFGFAFFIYSFSHSQFYADITKTSLIELTNQERAKNSLPPLNENPLLDSAAYMKALDMVKNGYFSHNSPAGINPWHWFDRSGYDYKYAGENLAIGFVESKEVSDAWVASPTHKANIVNNKYKDIGIAVLKANFQGNPVTLVVQLFGSKQGKAATQAVAPIQVKTGQAASSGADKITSAQEKKEVLGAATSAPDEKSAQFQIAKFLADKYFNLIQMLVYGSMAFVVLLLVLNFALKADFEHVDLLAKAFGFIAVMAVFAMIDQSLVVALLPHNLSIY